MTCIICIRDPGPNALYCPRCWNLIKNKPDHIEHRQVLIDHYDTVLDAFICHHTGVALNDTNPHDPWYVTFDHLVPGKKGTMAVAAWWVNDMKADMSEREFRAAVTMFAAYRRGEAVDWRKLKFRSWKRKPRPRLAGLSMEPRVKVTPATCAICDRKPRPHSIYCPRCRGFVFQGRDIKARRLAMDDGWDPKARGFRCHYTGALLDTGRPDGPWYMMFDHPTPGRPGRLVPAAAWINTMKMDLSEEEFLAIMAELDRHFQGAAFNKDVIKFRHWYRKVRPGG